MKYHSSLLYLSWATLILACALWIGVGFFVRTISAEESARATRLTSRGEESTQQAALLRLRALARETKDARTALEEIAHKDIVEILDSIERVGKDIGVPVSIGQALAASPGSDSSLRSLIFIVETEGTFTEVAQVIALLESLPTPSQVKELQLAQLPESEGAGKKTRLWRAVARIQFLTTADIPS